jgi:chitin-binding protein
MCSIKTALVGITAFIINVSQIMPAQAHGFISIPGSRAYLCQKGQNTGCGAVQYEPQSVEGANGFPAAGPADGSIASGGNLRFSELDAQSSTRWSKVTLHSGSNTFMWTLTQAHKTTNWKYYITKQGWNASKKLDRNAFDLTPFCQIDGKNMVPVSPVTQTCTLPANRSGYHVILVTWNIADTQNTFYQVIDANIVK